MADRFPKVSVIMSVFNNRPFISSAIESLLKQSYPQDKIEIIVIDDGSNDGTRDVLEKYKEKIIYIYQENKGIASARNKGMSVAKGEIITFLDGDDEWHEERILKVVQKFVDMPDVGIVYHPVELIDDKGVIIHKNFYKAFGYKEGINGWITNDIIAGRIFCGGSSFAFKKEIIDKAYPIPEGIKRGVDFYYTVISSCYAKTEYIPDLLGKYRLHGSNTTMARGEDNFRELAIVNKDFAFMRQILIDNLSKIKNDVNTEKILTMLKKIQSKEMIFYNVLDGKRLEGIKRIPSLFKDLQDLRDLIKGVVSSFMALFVPASLYPRLVKIYELLKNIRFKI